MKQKHHTDCSNNIGVRCRNASCPCRCHYVDGYNRQYPDPNEDK